MKCFTLIKQRRGAFQGIGRRVHEKTKIPEMPIRIADDGIKDEHVFQHGLAGRIERSVIVDDRLHAAACHNLTDRHKRDGLAGEQLASGAKPRFPFAERVGDGIHAERPGNLPGVEFGIRFIAGIGRPLSAPL